MLLMVCLAPQAGLLARDNISSYNSNETTNAKKRRVVESENTDSNKRFWPDRAERL